MRKIFYFICVAACILLSSCTGSYSVTFSNVQERDSVPVVACDQMHEIYRNGKRNKTYKLIELSIDGETHEYIERDYRELSHWAGCKYCKTPAIQEN